MSVERFFDREDEDKRFLYRQIQMAQDPVKAEENFRNCLAKINSPEHYREYAQSGFYTYVCGENRTIAQARAEIEKNFMLRPRFPVCRMECPG